VKNLKRTLLIGSAIVFKTLDRYFADVI